ncbi:MAG: hypothetical protein V9F04_14525 [Dermatophilaceae bacterium]
MSQIVDYGSAELEKRSIFYRLLVQATCTTAPSQDDIDLSSLSLVAVRQIDKGQTDLGLGERVGPQGHDRGRVGREAGPEVGRPPGGHRPAQRPVRRRGVHRQSSPSRSSAR